ncbi:MAG: Ig-like domain-containing protein, partial [Methylococcales bacterium]|nr:Ig-like domain-containing protein [Methylococcales bacterium]
LTAKVDDQGNTGSGGTLTDTKTVTINVAAVNDAPSIAVPSTQNTNEDTNLGITGINVSDVDVDDTPGGTLKVDLSVGHGTLSITASGNATISGNATNALQIIGNAVDVNATLGSLVYQGNLDFNGTDTLTAKVDDQGNTGSGGALTDTKTVTINVAAVNDASVITAPNAITILEDNTLSFVASNKISISDDSANLTISLNVDNGSLSQTFINGTVAEVNAALATLVFTPGANFPNSTNDRIVTLTITTSDGGFSTIIITVKPVQDSPTTQNNTDLPNINENEDDSTNLGALVSQIITDSGSGPTDVDGNFLGIAITSVDNTNGVWEYSTDGTNWIEISPVISPVSETNALLLSATDRVHFRPNPNFNGLDQYFTFKTWDGTSGTLHNKIDTTQPFLHDFASDTRVNSDVVGVQQDVAVELRQDGSAIFSYDTSPGGTTPDIKQATVLFDGSIVPESFVTNLSNIPEDESQIGSFSDGGYVIVWEAEGSSGNNDIFMKFYDASGNLVGNQLMANVAISRGQTLPSITVLPNDNFVVTWTDNASNNFNITARIFRRDGVAITSEFTINETLPGEQST